MNAPEPETENQDETSTPIRRAGRPSKLITTLALELHHAGMTYALAAELAGVSRATIVRCATNEAAAPLSGPPLSRLQGHQTRGGHKPFDGRQIAHEHAISQGFYAIPRSADRELRNIAARLSVDPNLSKDPEALPRVILALLTILGERSQNLSRRTVEGGFGELLTVIGYDGDSCIEACVMAGALKVVAP